MEEVGSTIVKDAVLNKQMKLLWIGMGTAEPNLFPGAFRAMLDKAGAGRVCFGSPGTAREWLTRRRSLYRSAPFLFRD